MLLAQDRPRTAFPAVLTQYSSEEVFAPATMDSLSVRMETVSACLASTLVPPVQARVQTLALLADPSQY